jgi:glycerol-3-phosphate dehydrogenase (NAD(P)+)
LDERLNYTSTLAEAVTGAELVLCVTPSQVTRSVVTQLLPHLASDALVVSATKGIETGTLALVSQVFAELLTPAQYGRFAVLSGPSFAREVAQEMPTAVAVAAEDATVAQSVQQVFNTPYFRIYTNDDVIGVELGGAIKNVIAIAAGIADGLGFGHNTRAALITRGLAEMTRLGIALQAKPTTFAGLAGMGDLVLTCTGDLSRNRNVGIKLGKGRRLTDILQEMVMVAEGVKTTESTHQLAQRLGVEMPITAKVYEVLYEDKPARQGVMELMTRDLKAEGM